MPFSPIESQLATLDELKNLSFTITYVDALGESFPVTVEALTPNSTVAVSGNSIAGYYSDAFTYSVAYKKTDNTYATVSKFQQVESDKVYELYSYTPNTTQSTTYTYVARAYSGSTVIATQEYTVVVTNNWSFGRNQLVKYTNPSKYNEIKVSWVNDSGQTIPMLNSNNEPITWENNS